MSNLCGDCGELQIQTMNFGGDGTPYEKQTESWHESERNKQRLDSREWRKSTEAIDHRQSRNYKCSY